MRLLTFLYSAHIRLRHRLGLPELAENSRVVLKHVQHVLVPLHAFVHHVVNSRKSLHHWLGQPKVIQLWHKNASNLLACLIQIVGFASQVHTLLVLVMCPEEMPFGAVCHVADRTVNFPPGSHRFLYNIPRYGRRDPAVLIAPITTGAASRIPWAIAMPCPIVFAVLIALLTQGAKPD